MTADFNFHALAETAPAGVGVLLFTSEPGRALLELVDGLVQAETCAIIVVDDGSAPGREWVLKRIGLEPTVHVLRHPKPQGEGDAVKTGISYALKHLRHYKGLVVAPGDGEYRFEDVLSMASAFASSPGLALVGARRSERGRRWLDTKARCDTRRRTKFVRGLVRLFTGLELTEPGCRLRALPMELLGRIVQVAGSGGDFGYAMLLHIARADHPVAEHAIAGGNVQNTCSTAGGSLQFIQALLRYSPAEDISLVDSSSPEPRLNGAQEPPRRKPAPSKQIH